MASSDPHAATDPDEVQRGECHNCGYSAEVCECEQPDIEGPSAVRDRLRWWWAELSFRWKWRKHPEVVQTISPHPGPSAAVERLRQRVLSGDWSSPDA